MVLLSLTAIAIGCGNDAQTGPGAPPTMTTATPAAPASGATTSPQPPPASTDTTAPVTTVDVGPPDTTPPRTFTIKSPPPVPVDKRTELEQHAAEFELLDPRRDPARYLALSTKYCAQFATEQDVRDSGTARGGGFLNEAEVRRLELVERGTRIVDIAIFGYILDTAQVTVRLDGDPPEASNSSRVRLWTLEDGEWRVNSCAA